MGLLVPVVLPRRPRLDAIAARRPAELERRTALEATLRYLFARAPQMAVLLVETFYGVPKNVVLWV